MRFHARFPAILAAALLVALPPNAGAGTDKSGSAKLQKEIDALVVQLESIASRGEKAARSGPTRLDGIAWESPEGLTVGTSGLGDYLNRQVGEAYSQRYSVASRTGGVGSRGSWGKLLSGAFRRVAGGIRLTLQLIDGMSDKKLSEVSKVLGFDLFPPELLQSIEPPDSESLLSLGRLVEESIGSESAFGLRVWTDRGKNAAYAEGEALSVFLEAERDCHVRLYHVSLKDRRLTLIHPNQHARDDFVSGGAVVRIPSDPNAVVFEVAKPYGVDAIVAVASEAPFADEEQVSSEWDSAEGPMPNSNEGDADDLQYEDGYVFEDSLESDGIKGVLDRGLLVRPGNERNDETGATEGSNAVVESEGIARASCYFATVKKLF